MIMRNGSHHRLLSSCWLGWDLLHDWEIFDPGDMVQSKLDLENYVLVDSACLVFGNLTLDTGISTACGKKTDVSSFTHYSLLDPSIMRTE